MTIEINKPETEALIQQNLRSGRFHDVDELLTEALDALQQRDRPVATPRPDKNLQQVFEAVRGLADDVDFSRNRSGSRAVDLS